MKPDRAVLLLPDPRWQHIAGDFDGLRLHADSWPVEPATPPPVARMLETARTLFAHGYFAYDFLPVAVTWSLPALEAALSDATGAGRGKGAPGLAGLIGRAQALGWFTEAQADSLRAGAALRDRLVHAEGHVAYTPGMAEPMLRSAHAAVANVYRRVSDGAGG